MMVVVELHGVLHDLLFLCRKVYNFPGVVRPQDLAATTFQHLGIDLNSHWVNHRGRPMPIVQEGGRPIPELG